MAVLIWIVNHPAVILAENRMDVFSFVDNSWLALDSNSGEDAEMRLCGASFAVNWAENT